MSIAYQNILVLGSGESALGAAQLAFKKGLAVFISDSRSLTQKTREWLHAQNISFEENGHEIACKKSFDVVVKSPGIPESTPIIQHFHAQGTPIISEIEWAYEHCHQDAKVIAVTGSNGKSTTVSLIYHILQHAGEDVALVGNIGRGFCRQIVEAPKKTYVVEVSSFQLDDIVNFRADIAVLLNLSEDHLDRYGYDFLRYIKSKFRLLENLRKNDLFIYNADDEILTQYLSNFSKQHPIMPTTYPLSLTSHPLHGAFFKEGLMEIHASNDEHPSWSMELSDLPLKGKHNQYNILAASAVASAMHIRNEDIREALRTFQGLAHRMEYIATHEGVRFINDSKATNIHSTWYALESMPKEKNTVLILGGVDKGNDYACIADLVRERVKAVVCLGKDNEKIKKFFAEIVPVVETHDIQNCVRESFALSTLGTHVLLSPACASFDLFKHFEDRGEQFRNAVFLLSKNTFRHGK